MNSSLDVRRLIMLTIFTSFSVCYEEIIFLTSLTNDSSVDVDIVDG
jgi:hypothetical protein